MDFGPWLPALPGSPTSENSSSRETVWKIFEGFSTVRVWWQKMSGGDSFVSSRAFSNLHFRAHFDFPDSLSRETVWKVARVLWRTHPVACKVSEWPFLATF